jgi:hypothetical protein
VLLKALLSQSFFISLTLIHKTIPNSTSYDLSIYLLQFYYTVIIREPIMNEQLEKPTPPADDDCCGGGACNPCVWDNYYVKLQKWRIEQSKLRKDDIDQ